MQKLIIIGSVLVTLVLAIIGLINLVLESNTAWILLLAIPATVGIPFIIFATGRYSSNWDIIRRESRDGH